jgi:conserved repeat domain
MLTTLKRLAFVGLFLLPLTATPAAAQAPTPEGTVIKNKATATFTDANSNSYASVSDSVSVTVGYLAGPSPSSPASVTPASPSTGNTLLFVLHNNGNGTDTMSVNTTVGSGGTITGYRASYNAGTSYTAYATQALMNAALATHTTLAKDSIYIEVTYNVGASAGGTTIAMTMTQTTKRTPTASASTTTNINPPASRSVAVTAVGATATQLPTNGTPYSYSFTVQNNGNLSDTYNLAAALAGTPSGAVTITTVNGVAGTTGSVTLAAGASTTIAVQYTVSSAVAAGASDKINFTATSQADALVKSTGDLTVTVTKAAVAIAKTAWMDNQTTQLTISSLVKPGDYIQYKIAVTNGASAAAAASVQISDALPAEVTYVSSSADAAGWTISQSAGTVTASLSGTLAASATRYIWVRVQVK